MMKNQKRTSSLKGLIITGLLIISSLSMAKEYQLVEVISDFFPRSDKLYLKLELDRAGQITHLKKQEFINGVMTDNDIFSLDQIKNPKSEHGLLIYSKDGRDVIWLKAYSPTVERNGGEVKITYLKNALALRKKNRTNSQKFRLQRDKFGEWKLTKTSSSEKINVVDFKKNGFVGVSKIEIAEFKNN